MKAAGKVSSAIGLVAVGGAVGLAAVAVHAWWWGLLLAAGASIASIAALPPRWYALPPFALGWWVPVGIAWQGRREGDYAIENTAQGYLLIALGVVVLVAAAFLVTLRWPARGSAPRGAR